MPVCFQLYPKGAAEPQRLQEVDDQLRLHFNQPTDPDHWLGGWYESIGLRLALGKTFEQIRSEFQKYELEAMETEKLFVAQCYNDLLKIVNYLEEHYTTNAWREGR